MEENNYEQVTPKDVRKDPDYATISGEEKNKPNSWKPKILVKMFACIIGLVVVVLLMEIYLIYATLPKQPNPKSGRGAGVTVSQTMTNTSNMKGTSPPVDITTKEVNDVNSPGKKGKSITNVIFKI